MYTVKKYENSEDSVKGNFRSSINKYWAKSKKDGSVEGYSNVSKEALLDAKHRTCG